MQRRRPLVLGLFLALLVSAMATSGLDSPAIATVGPNTSWSMRGDPGEFVLQGEEHTYGAGSGIVFTGDATRLNGTVDGWRLTVEPADGDLLQAGRTYSGATRIPFNAATEPGIDLDGHARGCNTIKGGFTIHELTFDAAGSVESVVITFQQYCDLVPAPANGSIAWQATAVAPALPPAVPAPPIPPKLKLTVTTPDGGRPGRKVVPFGTTLTVQATLSGESSVRELAVYSSLDTGPDRLVDRAPVDAAGVLTVPLTVQETTWITVRFDGGGTYPDREREVTVFVDAKIKTVALRAKRTRGRYHLYKSSSDPVVASLVQPNHRGDCIQFRSQIRTGKGWGYDAVTDCVKLNKKSAGAVRYAGDRRLVGIPIRVRSEFSGDARNPRARSTWTYLKFVR